MVYELKSRKQHHIPQKICKKNEQKKTKFHSFSVYLINNIHEAKDKYYESSK